MTAVLSACPKGERYRTATTDALCRAAAHLTLIAAVKAPEPQRGNSHRAGSSRGYCNPCSSAPFTPASSAFSR